MKQYSLQNILFFFSQKLDPIRFSEIVFIVVMIKKMEIYEPNVSIFTKLCSSRFGDFEQLFSN